MPALSDATRALAVEALQHRKENIPWMNEDRHRVFEQVQGEIAAIDNAIAELAQSAQPQGEWTPIDVGTKFVSSNTVHAVTVGYDCIDIEEFSLHTIVALPADYALCRRTPQPPSVGLDAPDGVAELRGMVNELLRLTLMPDHNWDDNDYEAHTRITKRFMELEGGQ